VIWPFSRKPRIELPEAETRRLAALKSAPKNGVNAALADLRWVVVDVETGGLDPHADPLLSIGAVEIRNGQIRLNASFEASLQQSAVTSHENILIHGLTHSQQLSGMAATDALLDFAEFAAGGVFVAFHAGFDRTALEVAMRKELGWNFPGRWLDAAVIAPLLFPRLASECRSLDDWLGALSIENYARHSAVADAAATAQLWLILLEAAARQHIHTLKEMESLTHARKWLGQ
jgi:DNA polymerase III, epsilon subunit and related 3''-5'' exonucleases